MYSPHIYALYVFDKNSVINTYALSLKAKANSYKQGTIFEDFDKYKQNKVAYFQQYNLPFIEEDYEDIFTIDIFKHLYLNDYLNLFKFYPIQNKEFYKLLFIIYHLHLCNIDKIYLNKLSFQFTQKQQIAYNCFMQNLIYHEDNDIYLYLSYLNGFYEELPNEVVEWCLQQNKDIILPILQLTNADIGNVYK